MTSGNDNLTPEVILSDTADRMTKSIDALKRELSTLRTGRATPAPVSYTHLTLPTICSV